MIEYIRLLALGITNFSSVINGVLTNIQYKFLSKEDKAIIDQRRSICDSCTFMSENYKKLGVYYSQRKDKHCALCKCNIHLKTACLKCSCGIEEYNKKHIENPLKLKWDKKTKNGKDQTTT